MKTYKRESEESLAQKETEHWEYAPRYGSESSSRERSKESFISKDQYKVFMAGGNKQTDYRNYQFKIDWTSSEPFDPESEMLDVKLQTQDGQEYIANFTTLKFLAYMFEKNKRTGECASGAYFCMPDNMVIVEKLTEDNVKKTIDDLIENEEVECYFKKAN